MCYGGASEGGALIGKPLGGALVGRGGKGSLVPPPLPELPPRSQGGHPHDPQGVGLGPVSILARRSQQGGDGVWHWNCEH